MEGKQNVTSTPLPLLSLSLCRLPHSLQLGGQNTFWGRQGLQRATTAPCSMRKHDSEKHDRALRIPDSPSRECLRNDSQVRNSEAHQENATPPEEHRIMPAAGKGRTTPMQLTGKTLLQGDDYSDLRELKLSRQASLSGDNAGHFNLDHFRARRGEIRWELDA